MSEAAHVMQYIVVPYRAAAGGVAPARSAPPAASSARSASPIPWRRNSPAWPPTRSWWTRKPATWDRLASWRRSAPCPRWTIEPAAHERTGRRPSGLTRPEVGKAMSRHGLRRSRAWVRWAPALAASTGDETLARLHRFLSRCALVACAFGLPAAAQTPPVKLVVGAPPGGTTDTVARNIGQHMSQTLRRTVMIENRPGAGGNRRRLRRQERARRQHAAGHLHELFDQRLAVPQAALRPGPRLHTHQHAGPGAQPAGDAQTSPPRTWPPSSNRSGRILASTRWRSARWARRCTWPASA